MSAEINLLSNCVSNCCFEMNVVESNSFAFKNNEYLRHKNVKHVLDLKTKGVSRNILLKEMYAPIPVAAPLKRDYIKLHHNNLDDKYTQNCSDYFPRTLNGNTVFTAANRGSRARMEDTFVSSLIKIKEENNTIEIPVFMVFDGHGGGVCSKFLASNFKKILKKSLSRIPLTDEVEIKFALKAAFLEADARFRMEYPKKISGSTAIVAIIINNILYVANAGDSRAILSSNNQVFQLSVDAVCTEEPFKSSIVKRGGKPLYYYSKFLTDDKGRFYLNESGNLIKVEAMASEVHPFENKITVDVNDNPIKIPVYSKYEKEVRRKGRFERVFLVPGRAIGDYEFPEVSARPKVKAFDLNNIEQKTNTFLLIASDGIWDMIESEEASAIAQKVAANITKSGLQVEFIAKSILRKAFKRDTQDNVTMMAIKLFDERNLLKSEMQAPQF